MRTSGFYSVGVCFRRYVFSNLRMCSVEVFVRNGQWLILFDLLSLYRKWQQELQYSCGVSDSRGRNKHNPNGTGVYHGYPAGTRGGV